MDWVKALLKKPLIAHWIRAFERFNGRLGRQFAAAITYFSVLSMVPILMVAFAGVGMTVTVFNPDLLVTLKQTITDALPREGGIGQQLTGLVDEAFGSWRTVGVIGLASALWTGSGWVKNVRAAVRAQIRNDFDDQVKDNFIVAVAKNILVLIAFLGLLGLTTAMSSVAVSLRDQLAIWFPAAAGWVGSGGFSAATMLGTLAAGFLLFCFVFWVLPKPRVSGMTLVKSGVMGALGMAALQYAMGRLVGVFANNPAAAVFGNVIVLMLFFNLFATLILLIAAWIGTEDLPESTVIQDATAIPHQPTSYASKLLVAQLREDPRSDDVPRADSVKATRVGLGIGAAAVGLLASVAAVISGLVGK
ncbi:MAG: YhjD/YihY/BrkB family envelope integrity protein [Propioniciclava sp.]